MAQTRNGWSLLGSEVYKADDKEDSFGEKTVRQHCAATYVSPNLERYRADH